MNKTLIILLSFLIFSLKLQAQKTILFVGATTHIGNGQVLENSIISVKNGVFDIESIGDRILLHRYNCRLIIDFGSFFRNRLQ